MWYYPLQILYPLIESVFVGGCESVRVFFDHVHGMYACVFYLYSVNVDPLFPFKTWTSLVYFSSHPNKNTTKQEEKEEEEEKEE